MEQVNNMLLELIQSAAQSTAPVRPQQGGAEESGSFQKLMEQHSQQAPGTDEKAGQAQQGALKNDAPAQIQPAEPGAAAVQEQMVWAAAAMLSNPVVPMQQAQAVPQAQGQTPVFAEGAAAPEIPAAVLSDTAQTAAVQQSGLRPIPQEGNAAPHGDAQRPQAADSDTAVSQTPGQPQPPQAQTGIRGTTQAQPEPGDGQTAAEGEKMPGAEITASFGSAPGQPQALFRDVEAVPVKVGEAQAQPESVETQIDARIGRALQQGESRVEVRLEPESLGTVTVELTHHADGSLHVVLSAESAQTRELLERHAPGLQGLLASRGPDGQVQVEVQRQQESQNQNGGDPYGGAQHGRQQEQQQRQQPRHTQDFFQQLRLGLIPLDDTAS